MGSHGDDGRGGRPWFGTRFYLHGDRDPRSCSPLRPSHLRGVVPPYTPNLPMSPLVRSTAPVHWLLLFMTQVSWSRRGAGCSPQAGHRPRMLPAMMIVGFSPLWAGSRAIRAAGIVTLDLACRPMLDIPVHRPDRRRLYNRRNAAAQAPDAVRADQPDFAGTAAAVAPDLYSFPVVMIGSGSAAAGRARHLDLKPRPGPSGDDDRDVDIGSWAARRNLADRNMACLAGWVRPRPEQVRARP
jgi:hypothetical protein